MRILKILGCAILIGVLFYAVPLWAADQEQSDDEQADTDAEAPAAPAVPLQVKPDAPKPDIKTDMHPPKHFDGYGIAVLQELDKMNARVQTVEVPVDKPISFGALEIVVKACRKTPPEDPPPESAAYVEIRDTRYTEKELETLFKGWMFASSPALSALEHPNYDVWLLDCKNAAAPARSAAEPKSSPKKASPSKAAPKSP